MLIKSTALISYSINLTSRNKDLRGRWGSVAVVKAIHLEEYMYLKQIRVEGPVSAVTHPPSVGSTNNNARV